MIQPKKSKNFNDKFKSLHAKDNLKEIQSEISTVKFYEICKNVADKTGFTENEVRNVARAVCNRVSIGIENDIKTTYPIFGIGKLEPNNKYKYSSSLYKEAINMFDVITADEFENKENELGTKYSKELLNSQDLDFLMMNGWYFSNYKLRGKTTNLPRIFRYMFDKFDLKSVEESSNNNGFEKPETRSYVYKSYRIKIIGEDSIVLFNPNSKNWCGYIEFHFVVDCLLRNNGYFTDFTVLRNKSKTGIEIVVNVKLLDSFFSRVPVNIDKIRKHNKVINNKGEIFFVRKLYTISTEVDGRTACLENLKTGEKIIDNILNGKYLKYG